MFQISKATWLKILLFLQLEIYVDQYARTFRANLLGYAQAQIHHSKKTYESLAKLREELEDTPLE